MTSALIEIDGAKIETLRRWNSLLLPRARFPSVQPSVGCVSLFGADMLCLALDIYYRCQSLASLASLDPSVF